MSCAVHSAAAKVGNLKNIPSMTWPGRGGWDYVLVLTRAGQFTAIKLDYSTIHSVLGSSNITFACGTRRSIVGMKVDARSWQYAGYIK